jgi:hypothetical protein
MTKMICAKCQREFDETEFSYLKAHGCDGQCCLDCERHRYDRHGIGGPICLGLD